MQQRCGLARALAVEPNVLLMDEPFAAVDAQTREILQFELLRIWEQRPTAMVFVTHSIEEAVLLGHRVIVLKGRPSSIHETITIDLPEPRTRETLARAALCRIARARLGHADAGGARSRIPSRTLKAEQENREAYREDSMIRRTIAAAAGGLLLATLLATPHRPRRKARKSSWQCRAFRRSFRSRSPTSPRSRASSKSTASTSKSSRSTTAPPRRARWSPATSTWRGRRRRRSSTRSPMPTCRWSPSMACPIRIG